MIYREQYVSGQAFRWVERHYCLNEARLLQAHSHVSCTSGIILVVLARCFVCEEMFDTDVSIYTAVKQGGFHVIFTAQPHSWHSYITRNVSSFRQ